MAETVLSMAKSILGSAVSKAAAAAASEISFLMGVKKEIWFIKDELKTIQAFLMAAEHKEKKDKLLKVWVEQVRDLSYDIEDCLDEFMVHVGSQSLSQKLIKLKHRHRIAVQIRDLKLRVEEVSNRNIRYKLIEPNTDKIDSYIEDARNLSAKNIDEAELVGFSNPKQDLLKLIDIHASHDHHRHQVISVVGMGGLGKTTLVRKVYQSIDIVENFSCRAWVTVSQSFDRKELLMELRKQLFRDDSAKENSRQFQRKQVSRYKSNKVEDLADDLLQGLQDRRYFVVLDDLWGIDDWDWINTIAFPKSNNNASRILVTTRDASIARTCASFPYLVYSLEALKIHHAKELLLKKAHKSNDDLIEGNAQHIFDMILKKCDGLPLAIVTIGSVLASKQVREWGKVYQQLPLELESNTSLEAVRRVVTLSYNYLPSHLKPCFLYLSIFPEDFSIKRRCLVNRWIAEGFVAPKRGMSVEDIGNNYFDDLINRSMIQPSKFYSHGQVQTCQLHDIVRDIAISISVEENFVFSTKECGHGIAPDAIRHLSIGGTKEPELRMDLSCVRSLTIFSRPMERVPLLSSPQLRMLRVLDLEHSRYNVTQNDMRNIGFWCHLKYLSVGKWSNVHSIPASIGNLRGLQTLLLVESYVTKLPAEVTKLRSLRILRCSNSWVYNYFDIEDNLKDSLVNALKLPLLPCNDRETRAEVVAELHSCWSPSEGVKVPRGIGRLKELQILEAVDIGRSSKKAVHELRQLTQLRKLALVEVTKRKFDKLCESLQGLSTLRSLSVDVKFGHRLPLHKLYSSSPPPLYSLKLAGDLAEIPDWVGKLTTLAKIQLSFSNLEGPECLRMLGELPNLTCLRFLYNSYYGEELVFHGEAFPKLVILELNYLKPLIKLTFEEGTSQKLKNITIKECRPDLVICGTSSLQSLEEISHFSDLKLVKVDRPHKQAEQSRSNPDLEQRINCGDANVSEEKEETDTQQLPQQEESLQLRPEPDAAAIKLKRSQSCPSPASAW